LGEFDETSTQQQQQQQQQQNDGLMNTSRFFCDI